MSTTDDTDHLPTPADVETRRELLRLRAEVERLASELARVRAAYTAMKAERDKLYPAVIYPRLRADGYFDVREPGTNGSLKISMCKGEDQARLFAGLAEVRPEDLLL